MREAEAARKPSARPAANVLRCVQRMCWGRARGAVSRGRGWGGLGRGEDTVGVATASGGSSVGTGLRPTVTALPNPKLASAGEVREQARP